MRRHLATSLAALAAAAASFSLVAGTALADGSTTATSVPAVPAITPAATTATTTSASAAKTAKPSKPVTSTKPTTTTPAPTVPAVKAKAHLLVTNVFVVHHGLVTVPGRELSIGGTVRPYVAGQWVEVQAALGHRRFKTDRLRIKPSKNGTYGHFTETLRSPGAGIIHVKVAHQRTAQMLGFLAARGVAALNPHAGSGSRGPFVLLVQERLAALHFYMPLSGVYDLQTRLAVDAYHRLLRRGTSSSLDGATLSDLLDGHGAFKVRYPHDGTHAEGNLGIQLLALIHGSKVDLIYPISSGKPSTPTILGKFHVYDRVPGYLPDGMYFSSFFTGGYAIHGYDPAPDYPASHGCMRVPISDALSIWHWINYGDGVDTYY